MIKWKEILKPLEAELLVQIYRSSAIIRMEFQSRLFFIKPDLQRI
jgi:hypothetical protein